MHVGDGRADTRVIDDLLEEHQRRLVGRLGLGARYEFFERRRIGRASQST
jgi:hypothetical protein